MLDLVTRLSPHFHQAYFFGAFALLDAGRPDLGYELLKRGFGANPDDWHFPFYLGFFVYTFAATRTRTRIAAQCYEKAAPLPGHLPSVPRLAAALYQKGHDRQKAMMMWAQVYGQGDKYSRQKAVAGARRAACPRTRRAHEGGGRPEGLMSPLDFNQLIVDVFSGYY